MAKTHRGKGIRSMEAHGRGTCPVCKAERVKLLYEQTVDGATVKVCKVCNATAKNKAKKEPKPVAAAAQESVTQAPAEA